MANVFDYLLWRGDLPFSLLPLNPVDSLILAGLSYVHYDGVISRDASHTLSLKEAADALLSQPDVQTRCRVKNDLELLKTAAETSRFGSVQLSCYQNEFHPEENTQFSAVAFSLGDGTSVLSFRGTDSTLVGWKEDFHMSFEESIPSQRLALSYTEAFAQQVKTPLWLTGHSKGGNLAVYAASACETDLQNRIAGVFNHDGPGFLEHITDSAGYQRILPKIHTYLPQSSVIGMLLERRETPIVIRSSQLGIFQHDLYSWEVMGGDFLKTEGLTADSLFWENTFENWLDSMTPEERNSFFDTLFGLIQKDTVTRPRDIMKPQNLAAYIRTLSSDPALRKTLKSELENLWQAARGKEPEKNP